MNTKKLLQPNKIIVGFINEDVKTRRKQKRLKAFPKSFQNN